MSQQHLFFMCIICTFLFVIIEMYSINGNPDAYQRYQRGFSNRRALGTRLKYHYPKESLFRYDNQDNLRDDKHLFPNSYESIEQNDIIQQQQQQPPIIYR